MEVAHRTFHRCRGDRCSWFVRVAPVPGIVPHGFLCAFLKPFFHAEFSHLALLSHFLPSAPTAPLRRVSQLRVPNKQADIAERIASTCLEQVGAGRRRNTRRFSVWMITCLSFDCWA